MANTLKTKYDTKILEEAKRVTLILEALDQQKVQDIANAIDALEKLIPQNKIPQFYKAVQSAKNELSKALSGGAVDAAVQSVTQPISRAVALADGLKAGFRTLPQLLKTFVPQQNQGVTNQPIQKLIDPARSKQFSQAFLNAIRPTGFLATLGKLFGSGSGIPFLANAQNAVYELMANMTPDDLTQLAQAVSSAPQTVTQDVAKELQAAATQQQPNSGSQTGTKPEAGQEPQGTAEASKAAAAFTYIKDNILKLPAEQQKAILNLLQNPNKQPFPKATN